MDRSELYDRGVKTFVAPVVGGTLHGKLRLVPVGVLQFMLPRAVMEQGDIEFDLYLLKAAEDGSLAWVLADAA